MVLIFQVLSKRDNSLILDIIMVTKDIDFFAILKKEFLKI